jgi:integrase
MVNIDYLYVASAEIDGLGVAAQALRHDDRDIAGRVLRRAVQRAALHTVLRDGTVIHPAPTFHSFRHSHASALIAAGWDIEEVSARLGHANVATTQLIYVHAFDAVRRSQDRRDRLAALYSGQAAAGRPP